MLAVPALDVLLPGTGSRREFFTPAVFSTVPTPTGSGHETVTPAIKVKIVPAGRSPNWHDATAVAALPAAAEPGTHVPGMLGVRTTEALRPVTVAVSSTLVANVL